MITYEELEKTAASIEQDGFLDDNQSSLTKTAQALYLLKKLEKEIDEPINFKDFEKEASFGNKLAKGIGQTAVVGLGVAIAGLTAKEAEKSYNKNMFKKKQNGIIAFSKHENPSLKDVSNGKLRMWLNSAYAVSPRVAKDPMLASSYLNTAHAVGGVDLNTAKTVAEIQQRGGGNYNKLYDAISGQSAMTRSAFDN